MGLSWRCQSAVAISSCRELTPRLHTPIRYSDCLRSRYSDLLFGSTVFVSAFLLFSVEPLVAKRILPWYGGSAAVWSTCLVFFQTALLLGYWYARLLTRYAELRVQFIWHSLLLCATALFLPIGPGYQWRPNTASDPIWHILALLTATLALPFIALSATSSLLQYWLTRSGHSSPYRFFAVSNLASLGALLAYPTLIEPKLDLASQRVWWSCAYAGFAILCITCGWRSRGGAVLGTIDTPDFEWIPPWRKALWFALAACGGMLLLSVTNHLTENVAAVPLLWVLPLAVYLLSFILTFGRKSSYLQGFWLRLLALMLGLLGYALSNINWMMPLQISVPIFLIGLCVCCMFCHGELYRLRPPPHQLTEFYLVIAAGGAAGAIFVGLIAPAVFDAVYELPVTLLFTAALAGLVTWRIGWQLRTFWIAFAICMGIVLNANWKQYHENTLALRRSFYGALRVVQSPHAGLEQTRTLFHGTIEHGAQYLWPPLRSRPTTYYGPDSGIGIVLREGFSGPKRVGLVGLGIGTLAAYGQPGDTFRFYEINRQVIDLAQALFFYLRETQAQTAIIEGDGRLSLQKDTSPPFDVLALDAFSGDAIPVHLLTKEAGELYRKHLKPNGVIAFHVSNDFLDLAPVVQKLAETMGYQAVLVRSHSGDDLILAADWVLVTNNPDILNNEAIKLHAGPISQISGLRVWTDDYSNLFQIIKTPTLH